MKAITVSVAEGKRDFSSLIREAVEKNEDIIVTKRGKPMAVIRRSLSLRFQTALP
ncbi:MAG: type II toxin-antitoxin system Phd/YefM family antitoxin [Candidatus Lindowbacteria bacterium]|nr:type II toxin-antitoxin system Phd/YefM family antitoxin [Candidatus Lindowbacteria bacterium]